MTIRYIVFDGGGEGRSKFRTRAGARKYVTRSSGYRFGRNSGNFAVSRINILRRSTTTADWTIRYRHERFSDAFIDRAKRNNRGLVSEPDVSTPICRVLRRGDERSTHCTIARTEQKQGRSSSSSSTVTRVRLFGRKRKWKRKIREISR